jgi:phosphatidylinositol alpha-1,6-mannosyltransferase
VQRFDVVFCGHINLIPLAFLVARIHGARLVVQAHGIEVWSAPDSIKRYSIDRADMILSVSRFTRCRLLEWSVVPPERVIVVANTYRREFCIGQEDEIRTPKGLEGKKVLLTVGRLDACQQHKGHEKVIRCLPQVWNRYPDLVYVIVGEGKDRERLETLVRQLAVSSIVQFTGRISNQALVDYYRAADLLVMPSTGDGFGIVFLEAMACGTPVLGLDAGGVRDAMGDGDLGLVIKEDELSDAIDRALATCPVPRLTLSDRVRSRFGRQIFESRIQNAIERLAA